MSEADLSRTRVESARRCVNMGTVLSLTLLI